MTTPTDKADSVREYLTWREQAEFGEPDVSVEAWIKSTTDNEEDPRVAAVYDVAMDALKYLDGVRSYAELLKYAKTALAAIAMNTSAPTTKENTF